MKKFLRSGNAKLYGLLLAVFLVVGAWRAGETVDTRLAALQVKQVPHVDRGSVPIDVKSFYPVWVKQAAATPPVPQGDGSASLDVLFNVKNEPKPEDLKPLAPLEPDYVQMFKRAAAVGGISDDGVFINGRFYAIGEPLDELAMSGPRGARVVPAVESIRDGRITFRIGGKHLVFFAGGSS